MAVEPVEVAVAVAEVAAVEVAAAEVAVVLLVLLEEDRPGRRLTEPSGFKTRTTRISPRGRTRRKTKILAARPRQTSKTSRNPWRSKPSQRQRRPRIFTRCDNMFSRCPIIGSNRNGGRLNTRRGYSTALSPTRLNSSNTSRCSRCTALLASSSSSSNSNNSSSSSSSNNSSSSSSSSKMSRRCSKPLTRD